ncbi:MAG TPA: hypothetical protein GX507_02035 [Clostridia bacterium]|nr:hypothetical protein [Clostridia bacterium]
MELSEFLSNISRLHTGLRTTENLIKKTLQYEQDSKKDLFKDFGQRLAILEKLQESVLDLEQMVQFIPALHDVLQEGKKKLVREAEEKKERFGPDLEEELKQRGFLLRGQYPELKCSFFVIETDFNANRATIWYGPKQERLTTCVLSAPTVAQHIQTVRERLGSQLEAQDFLKKLRIAYNRVVAASSDRSPQPARIIDVLAELAYLMQGPRFRQDPRKENFTTYGRADFSYDLFRLREEGSARRCLHLSVASRAHTQRRQDFLWIPDDESGNGTTYSHLEFREELAT